MKRLLSAVFAALMILALWSSCASADEAFGILINDEIPSGVVTVDLSRSNTLDLSANRPVQKWTSSSRRCSIDENGHMTVNGKGSFVITALAEDGSKATVRFKGIKRVTQITITGQTDMTAKKTAAFKAVVLPSDADSRKVIWSSSDPSVATVNSSGRVTAQNVDKLSTVTIYATAADGSGTVASFDVTVHPVVSSVTLYLNGEAVNGKTIDIDLASVNSLDLTAVVLPEDANQSIKWTTSSRSYAIVDENGKVSFLRKGVPTITATAMDGSRVKASVKFKIAVLSKSIEITGANSVTEGKSIALRANVQPANTTNKKVTWSSSDPSIATVNSKGRVTAKNVESISTVTIRATAVDGGSYKDYTVTVYPLVSSVTLYLDGEVVNGKTLKVDLASVNSLNFEAVVSPSDARQDLNWSSSSRVRASVASGGAVSILRKGMVTITATAADGSRVKANVKLDIGVVSKSISITGASSVIAGKSITLKTAVMPNDTVNKKVVWSTSDPSVATVSSRGVVKAGHVNDKKTVTITATAVDGGSKASYVVAVMPLANGIGIKRDGVEIPSVLFLDSSAIGSQIKLKVDVYPSAAAQNVTWTSGNNRIVRVDGNGVVTCVGSGKTIVTVKASDGSRVSRSFYVAVGDFSKMPYYIEVDKTNQVVRVYERGDGTYTHLVRRMICSTGAVDDHLVDGLYAMNGAHERWCLAVDRQHWMPYATRISGSYWFHGVPTTSNKGNTMLASYYADLGKRASGGCIRLLVADSKWIYENVPSGSYVLVFKGARLASEYGAVKAPPLGMSGSLVWDPTDDDPANPTYDPTYTSAVK